MKNLFARQAVSKDKEIEKKLETPNQNTVKFGDRVSWTTYLEWPTRRNQK